MDKAFTENVLCEASSVINATTLVITNVNPTGCATSQKGRALESLCAQEGSDVMILTETMLTEGREPLTLVEGYRTFYNSTENITEGKRLAGVC